ncbi:MAG: hypothetical protein KDD52_04570 [Bdellovibrionales bacterium]|nr:hypothetical protein [Bdellovibrionales bacterium]
MHPIQELYISNFSEKIQSLIGPEASIDKKLSMAEGLIPLSPKEWLPALAFLLYDESQKVVEKALHSLQDLPESLALPIASDSKTLPFVLDKLAQNRTEEDAIIEHILLNPSTQDQTIIDIAKQLSQKNATLLMSNQVRIMQNPKIAESIRLNPQALKSDIEKMVSFLRINGISIEGEASDLTMAEIELILKSPDGEGMKKVPESLLKEEQEEVDEETKLSMYQLVQTLSTGEKIKLALKGNKEARTLLIKESNKVVSSAVIKNPRITDGEVLAICNNKAMNEDIIRMVSEKKDWVKHYSVQQALAGNPKTPHLTAMRFTRALHVNDLRRLAKNKNAPSQIQKLAKQMFQQKMK